MDKSDKRKQINIRLDDDLVAAIEDLRALVRPIPTVTAIIREALIEKRDRVRRRAESEAKA